MRYIAGLVPNGPLNSFVGDELKKLSTVLRNLDVDTLTLFNNFNVDPGPLTIRVGGEKALVATKDGSVDLYYNDILAAGTHTVIQQGFAVYSSQSGDPAAAVAMSADLKLTSQDGFTTGQLTHSEAGASINLRLINRIWGGEVKIAAVSAAGVFATPFRVQSVAGATALAFHNTAPINKPTIAGAKGGNVALANLLTALANYGLLVDTTT